MGFKVVSGCLRMRGTEAGHGRTAEEASSLLPATFRSLSLQHWPQRTTGTASDGFDSLCTR